MSTLHTLTTSEFSDLVSGLSATKLPVSQPTYAYDAYSDAGVRSTQFLRVVRGSELGTVNFYWTGQ